MTSKIYTRFVLVGWIQWSLFPSDFGIKEGSERRLAKLYLSDRRKFRITQDTNFASFS